MVTSDDKAVNDAAAKIKLLILDVDGVLTDGRFLLGPNGEEYKAFNTQDGQGLRSVLDQGMQVGIITGRSSKVVEHRANDLGIQHVYQGCRDKIAAFEDMLKKLQLNTEQCAYIGDDWPDIAVMKRVGLPIAVNNARPETKQAALFITPNSGGLGGVRDACELLLKSQGSFEKTVAQYV